MPKSIDRVDQILDVAERMARLGGYNSFSFREIAAEVGIKSASVHYHFATKEDLAIAVARRYTENFLKSLGKPEECETTSAVVINYARAYEVALLEDGLMCLCGVLGTEIAILPKPVAAEAKRFFDRNIDWLVTAFEYAGSIDSLAKRKIIALRIIATLEGAMMMAKTFGDHQIFLDIIKDLEV